MTDFAPMMNLEAVAMAKFDDMATQLKVLYSQGRLEEAELLKKEGFELANALDNGTPFLYLSDFSSIV
jgi:hypothetical protein